MQYDALAPIYDRLMSHVEYDEWVGLIKRVIGRYSASASPEILEMGAGTGIVGAILREKGYRYTASDLSPPMCAEAARRRGLPICAADARRLPFRQVFDLALFLYDGINYIMTLEDYRRLFASVCDVLRPGGLFLFDITTQENSHRHFTHYLDFEDYGDFSYARSSYFDERRSIQHNDFTIYRQSGEHPRLYEKYVETHRQKVFSVPEIERAIPKKRVEVLGIWDGFSFKKHTERSIRVHFLLRKNEG
ncbi:MAG: class I SAM-dependent methyltransferase [Chitinispirillales bacterium]|jgi:SAM-dependent methyltransferase|nr:class I SAM-dependent methyltransferase [Chitinispirillales bacterium]